MSPMATKEAQRAYQTAWMKRRREAWLAANGPCRGCGTWTDDLQVDHCDPALKVSHRIWSWSEARRSEELAKCQVLCAPCHRSKTNDEMGWTRAEHGTRGRYRQYGCRCELCRAWKAISAQHDRLRHAGLTDMPTPSFVLAPSDLTEYRRRRKPALNGQLSFWEVAS